MRLIPRGVLDPVPVAVLSISIQVWDILGVFSHPFAQLLYVVSAFHIWYDEPIRAWHEVREADSRHDGGAIDSLTATMRDIWTRHRFLEYVPLLLALIGTYGILVGVRLYAPRRISGLLLPPMMVQYATIAAAGVLGMRAGTAHSSRRDIVRDLIYGPGRWLLPACLVMVSFGFDALDHTIALSAVLLFCLAAISLNHEPMFLTRRGIAAWKLRDA